MKTPNQEDIAATAVSIYQSMSNKRTCVEVSDASDDESVQSTKRRRLPATTAESNGSLRPAPFFYYSDYSKEQDDDPLAPLTPPGSTANFPAKMHAMLSRKDITGVVAWLPHGRAWRVLKPKDFASDVVPSYFGHSKFASFVRQANGWGFRRITSGPDRGSYYHERFLRGLPHLCKKMKRPGKNEKMAIDSEHEPDLYKISEMFPITEEASADDGILLESTFKKVRPCATSAAAPASLAGCSSKSESIPRSITPVSVDSPPQSPKPSNVDNSPAHHQPPSALNIPQTIAPRPQGPTTVVQRPILPPVPVNFASQTACAPNSALPHQALPSLQQRAAAFGAINPSSIPAIHALLRGAATKQVGTLPINPLQGFPPSALLEQALLAASCGRPAFM